MNRIRSTRAASWFETREDALLTMRDGDLILEELREAMRLEGRSPNHPSLRGETATGFNASPSC
jgi:hypothetical protein